MIRATRHTGFDFRDARILIADDEGLSRALAYSIVSKFDCALVDAVQTGREALDFLFTATRPYHLVISDFDMPDMNGLELLKAVRTGSPGIARDIGFAMLTGYTDKGVVGAAFNLDVDCFIVKPVSADRMRGRLARILSTDRPIRRPPDYMSVNINGVEDASGGQTAGRASPGVVDTSRATSGAGKTGTPIDQVIPGSVLSDDLFTSSGQKLLNRGFTLDKRMIERLKDLSELDAAVGNVSIERRR